MSIQIDEVDRINEALRSVLQDSLHPDLPQEPQINLQILRLGLVEEPPEPSVPQVSDEEWYRLIPAGMVRSFCYPADQA